MVFSVDVPANGTVVLVIHDVAGTAPCASPYSVLVEGLPCSSLARSAVSRKAHGPFSFDVPLPLSGISGVECRRAGATGDHHVVVNFPGPVSLHGTPPVEIVSGIGVIGSNGMADASAVTVSGASILIPLTNVANAQAMTLRLNSATVGGATGNVILPMRFVWGDTSGNGLVNAADVGQVKSLSGSPLSPATFRADVNASGAISAADVSVVKAQSGINVPP
jgi:hypothetical protein